MNSDTTNKTSKIIEMTGLTKRFGKTLAVDSLDLTIDRGELFGFLGPNGAGKTTTIKMITGLVKPTSGSVEVDGHDVQSEPEKAKSVIGYIPDTPYLYDRLTGREFLDLVGGLYDMPKAAVESRIEWLFELFGIEGWGDDFAGEYSHGMRQKIVMASALLHDPELIVIDEPMVGLDPQSQRLVKDVLIELVSRGKTVFMSTHTLSVAAELCTRIGLISKGKLMETLPTASSEELERRILKITGGEPLLRDDLERLVSCGVEAGFGDVSLVTNGTLLDARRARSLAAAERVRERLRIYFAVSTLEYLHRNGRIGGAAKLLGTMLQLKPLLILDNKTGFIDAVERTRTWKKALGRVYEVATDGIEPSHRVRAWVMHAAAPADAMALAERINVAYNPVSMGMGQLSPVLGAHVGPGTVGMVIYDDEG